MAKSAKFGEDCTKLSVLSDLRRDSSVSQGDSHDFPRYESYCKARTARRKLLPGKKRGATHLSDRGDTHDGLKTT
jgi:hypothetical protein